LNISTFASRRVNNDADRARVRSFFDTNMEDRTGFPILSRAEDFELGVPSTLRIIEDEEGEVAGAVYASSDPEDILIWRERGEFQIADLIAADLTMIHDIATRPDLQRQGVGAKLVRAVIDDARAGGSSVVVLTFDERSPGLANFYKRTGFTLLHPAQHLSVQFSARPGTVVRFPQDNPAYRWAYRTIGQRATVVS